MGFIDIHAHLDMLDENGQSPDFILDQARSVGVDKIITIGTEEKDLPVVLAIAKKHYPNVYCTLGVHPHHGSEWNNKIENFILTHANEKEVVAIGEIGLDYYYKNSPPADQRVSFEKQLELAEKLNMPVQIHTRDADEDTIDILRNFKNRVKGVIHCFAGTENLARQCLDFGFNISMSGVVTFKNAQNLRDILSFIPLDRLHVETDSPFLSPVPVRGVKNQPAHVIHTAQLVAQIKNISLRELENVTNENARQLFPKIIW
jgi:TatD DNase family protein